MIVCDITNVSCHYSNRGQISLQSTVNILCMGDIWGFLYCSEKFWKVEINPTVPVLQFLCFLFSSWLAKITLQLLHRVSCEDATLGHMQACLFCQMAYLCCYVDIETTTRGHFNLLGPFNCWAVSICSIYTHNPVQKWAKLNFSNCKSSGTAL